MKVYRVVYKYKFIDFAFVFFYVTDFTFFIYFKTVDAFSVCHIKSS